jgi:DNA-binding transcriptional MerR regulator
MTHVVATSLAIGDFSRATQLSVKTLRHYHTLGLLVPARVDSGTGYRRYTTDQIPTAQVIRRFRDLDVPLDDIREVLRAADPRTRNQLIARHLARVEQELARTQTAAASLRRLLEDRQRHFSSPIEASRISRRRRSRRW